MSRFAVKEKEYQRPVGGHAFIPAHVEMRLALKNGTKVLSGKAKNPIHFKLILLIICWSTFSAFTGCSPTRVHSNQAEAR